MATKVLIHFTENWQPLADITIPVLTEYCEKFGYELCVRKVPEYPVYTGVEKLKMILECLEEGDVGLVMDADAIITRFDIKIEDFLEDGKDLYFSEGLNCGIFIVKKTEWNTFLFNNWINSIGYGFFHCEQDAVETHMRAFPESTHVRMLKHPCFNSYLPELYGHIEKPEEVTEEQGRWIEGKSFILHLPALGMDQRLEILKNVKITK